MSSSLKPLESTLESILGRLAMLESKAGIVTSVAAAAVNGHSTPAAATGGGKYPYQNELLLTCYMILTHSLHSKHR